MVTDEQAEQVKQQLLGQLESFPEEKRDQIKKQILAMNTQDVEEFIKQNKLNHLNSSQDQNPSQQGEQQCIFCSIINGTTKSYKIDENKDNMAILEINPLSKGYSLVLPKKHLEIEKIPSSSFTLAKSIAKRIKTKFKPQEIQITSKKLFGHSIVEILPLYGDEKERKQATEEELTDLQKQLEKKHRQTPVRIKSTPSTSTKSKVPQLKPRQP